MTRNRRARTSSLGLPHREGGAERVGQDQGRAPSGPVATRNGTRIELIDPPGAGGVGGQRPRSTKRSTLPVESAGSNSPVSRRLASILARSTSRCSRASRNQAVAEPTVRNNSVNGRHSACQAPAPRSCSEPPAAVSSVATSPGACAAQARAETAAIGFRLCGMARRPAAPRRRIESPRRPPSGRAGRGRGRAWRQRPRSSRARRRDRRSGCARCARARAGSSEPQLPARNAATTAGPAGTQGGERADRRPRAGRRGARDGSG